MSFWWSPKSSSPKEKVLECSSSFSSFEQLTKDAWEVAGDSIDNILVSDQESLNKKSSIGENNSHINDPNINVNSSLEKLPDYELSLDGISNDSKKTNSDKNFRLIHFTDSHNDNRSLQIDNYNFNKTNCVNNFHHLQLPVCDVHRLAEEIVQHHRLSLKTLPTDKQNCYQNSNSNTEQTAYDRQLSENTIQENMESIINNNSINKDKLQKTKNHATRSNSLGSGKILGPGIGVRKKDIYSNNWSKYAEEEKSKILKFSNLLASSDLDIDCLRKLSWSGIPMESRADVWKILCGYLPLNPERREVVINRKRLEYLNCVEQYFGTRQADGNKQIYHQIHIDIPRMQVLMKVFQQIKVQEMFERILYTWAIRHPASSYVQGINDLLVPFFVVFLSKHIDKEEDLENFEVDRLSQTTLNEVEADSYWCLSRLLDGIQDNYTFAQPGIQRQVNLLKELTARLDNDLHEHLMEHQIEYLQFSFRWFNNLLMREIPLHCAIRLWDTFLSEVDGFTQLHLFVCSALLKRYSNDILKENDFQGIMLFLGRLPTENWNSSDISLLLADAHRLRYLFADTPNHYRDI